MAVNKKMAAFKGYSVEMQEKCTQVGKQYIQELTKVRSAFMSTALMAVGDPSLLRCWPHRRQ